MRKRWALAGAVAAIVTVGASSTAGAIPKREPEVWTCPGGTTMIVTAGRNGWIGDTHYQAVTFSATGTFTPTGGTAEPFTEFKQWAGGAAGPGAITCTMHVDDTSPDGHFVADFRVTAVPA
jgi:hypothetical protein